MFKLIYTSVPKGLIQGRSGFTTVAMTEGFPSNLIPLVENMSGYRNIYPPEDPNAARNPVNCTYFRQRFGSTEYSMVSRIAYHGLSYTGRSNTLAVHLLFTPEEMARLDVSPAQLLQADENFEWSGEISLLPVAPKLKHVHPASKRGPSWDQFFGDGDWARVLAWKFRHERSKPVFIAFDPMTTGHQELMSLMAEISACLSPAEQLEFSFSTYSYQSSISNPLFIRAYPLGSPFLASVMRLSADSVFTLGQPKPIPEFYKDQMEKELRQAETAVSSQTAADKEVTEPLAPTHVPSTQTRIRRNLPQNALRTPTKPVAPPVEAPEKPRMAKWYMIAGSIVVVLLAISNLLFFQARQKKEIPEPPQQKEVAASLDTQPLASAPQQQPIPVEKADKQIPPPPPQQLSAPDVDSNGAQPSPQTAAIPQPAADVPRPAAAVQEAPSANQMPSRPASILQRMEHLVRREAEPPVGWREYLRGDAPGEWLDFLKGNYGEITYSNDLKKAIFIPSQYLVACMRENLLNRIEVSLFSEPVTISSKGPSIGKKDSKNNIKWNPDRMELNTGYDAFEKSLKEFNSQLEKCLKYRFEKERDKNSDPTYNLKIIQFNNAIDIAKSGKQDPHMIPSVRNVLKHWKPLSKLPDNPCLKDLLKLQRCELPQLRKKLDALQEKAGDNEIVKGMEVTLGKPEECTNRECLFCYCRTSRETVVIKKLGNELGKSFNRLSDEIRKFPAFKEFQFTKEDGECRKNSNLILDYIVEPIAEVKFKAILDKNKSSISVTPVEK